MNHVYTPQRSLQVTRFLRDANSRGFVRFFFFFFFFANATITEKYFNTLVLGEVGVIFSPTAMIISIDARGTLNNDLLGL